MSFNFGSLTSPTNNVFQLQEDLLQYAPTVSAAASIPTSPSWSEVGLTYQINTNNSTVAILHMFLPSKNVLPPPSPFLYHDVPALPASVLFDTLLTIAHNKLHELQHELLNLLSNVTTHTTDFNMLIQDLPFIEEVKNVLPPISAVLLAHSPSPKYIIQSPTLPLHYLFPIAATTIQPPPTIDEAYSINFNLFPHLFAVPPYIEATQQHPHLYTVLHERGEKIWYPQEEFVNQDFLANIPCTQHLNQLPPHFITPFHACVYHKVIVCPQHTLSPVTLCAKVGLHPSSLYFPFGYLELSFIDSLKFIFRQFPPIWLTYFEGVLVPITSHDFLDSCLVTICGHLHFTEEGLFVINQQTRIEDLLHTNPGLAQFTCTSCTPTDPLLYITPLPVEQPL